MYKNDIARLVLDLVFCTRPSYQPLQYSAYANLERYKCLEVRLQELELSFAFWHLPILIGYEPKPYGLEGRHLLEDVK